MRVTSNRYAYGALLLLAAVLASYRPTIEARAQQPGQITSQQFQANPAGVLSKFPNGGPVLISLIRQLALADQANLPLIIQLLSSANSDQANAIGTGLGQAALASVTNNPTYANEIQTELVAANNQPAALAFAAIMGNQAIGAAGGGGGGGGGGGPITQLSNGNGSSVNGVSLSTSTNTTPTNFLTLNSSSSPGSPASRTNQPVSPSK
jgi:hypothetical protein